MRACFYHTEGEWTGRARAFADAADGLRARGHEVTLVCGRGTSVERRFAASGHEVIPLRVDGGWLRVAWRLRDVLRRRFVEVTFVHSEREQLEAAAAARLSDRGVVVRRIPPLARLTMGRDARFGMRLAGTGFLFAFEEDRRGSQPPRRALEACVAPPGAMADPTMDGPPAARDAATWLVACIFDAARHTRMSTALRALALVAERHAELRIALVGPAGPGDALRFQAAALGIGDITEFVPDPSNGSAAHDVLARAGLAWIFAEGDTTVYGILDGQSIGVPVLAERDPLSARLVEHDVTGVLTGPVDPTGSAALVVALLADLPRRARLAQGGRAALARWPLAAMIDGFERAAASARDRSRWRV